MKLNYMKARATLNSCAATLGLAVALSSLNQPALAAQAPVNLGSAGNYVILTKSGISTVPPCAVTGDLGASPIDSTAIPGVSLILDGSGQFATSSQVTGRVYAPDYSAPTPVTLTAAISDMQTALYGRRRENLAGPY